MAAIQFKVLTDGEVERIHEKTLEALEGVGIKVTHDEALRLLKDAGANVSESSGLVKFPKKLSEELINQIPEYAARSGINGKILNMGGDNTYFGSLVIDPCIVDYHRGLRKPVLNDIKRNTIVGEALDKIGFMARMEYPVEDIPGPDSYLKTMEVYLKNHTKHNAVLPTSRENLKIWLKAFDVIADVAGIDLNTNPLITLYMAVTSPLQIHGFNIEIIKAAVDKSFPVRPTVCPMAGATSPYSIAGSILIGNIESIAAGMLTQVYKKGHPFIYTSSPSVMDMKTGHDLYHNLPFVLFEAGGIQMAKFYNIPSSSCGSGSLSWRPDIQGGIETTLINLMPVALKANEVFGVGSCHNSNGMSPEHVVMNSEIMSAIEYLCRGIDTSDEKTGFDSIFKTGPGGNFMMDKLTLEGMDTGEFFRSEIFDMTGGYQENAKSMYELAHEKVEDIIANHSPSIDGKIVCAIEKYFHDLYITDEAKQSKL